jgi:type IV pilus assembly protein PilM
MSSQNPTSVYLTGGGAQFASMLTILQDKMKLPVHRFATLRRVEMSPDVRNGRVHQSSALLAQLVGLASGLILRKRPTVNLLPPVVRDELAFRRRQPLLIAAAAIIVVALIPPLHHFHSVAKAGQARVAKIEADIRPLRKIKSRQAALTEAIERAHKEVSDLQRLAASKTSWLRFFADIQSRLVDIEDVWLESLVIVHDPVAERAQNNSTLPQTDLRLVLNGRLVDQRNPLSKVSPESFERVKQLIASLSDSKFIAGVEREQFDNTQPGILRFNFTLIVRAETPL